MTDPTKYPTVTSHDASTFRVSALGVNIADISNDDADDFRMSAFSEDADDLMVSTRSDDAALMRVSALVPATVAVSGTVTANVPGIVPVSGTVTANVPAVVGISGTVVATQTDATNLRLSASLFAGTVGSLTIHRSMNVSASHNVKATAGAIYGYYAYNFDPTPSYVKFYNVSGAINVGTDVPVITIAIPASAAANMQFTHGLAGFTTGISITAISGAPDDNTAAVGASSVGINLFYK